MNQSTNNNRAAHVQYIRNQEEENGEQNRYLDEPSPIPRRLSINPGVNQPPNEPVNVQIQETNYPSGTSAHIVSPVRSMFMVSTQTLPILQSRINTNRQEVNTFQDLFSTQPPLIDPTAGASSSTSVAAYEQSSDYDTMHNSPPPVSRHTSHDVAGHHMINVPNDYTSTRFFPDDSFDSLDGISLDDLMNTPLDPYLPSY